MIASTWPWCIAILVVAAGCGTSTFECQTDAQCEGGMCLADGFCGFPAEDCSSGLRYGEHSGPLSGQCVPAVDTDTDVSTAATRVPSSTDGSSTSTTDGSSSSGDPVVTSSTSGPASTSIDDASTTSTVDPSLVLWLDFEGDATQWLQDRSAFGNDAACMNMVCPMPEEGIVGNGASFKGDSVLLVPHSVSLETPMGFTVSVWHRVDFLNDAQRSIFTKPVGDDVLNSWELYYFASTCPDCPFFSMGEVGLQTQIPVESGAWIHLAGTWDGFEMALWVDGELVSTAAVPELMMDEQPVHIGADDDHDAFGLDGWFLGTIDEVRIYDRRLADDEIKTLAQFP